MHTHTHTQTHASLNTQTTLPGNFQLNLISGFNKQIFKKVIRKFRLNIFKLLSRQTSDLENLWGKKKRNLFAQTDSFHICYLGRPNLGHSQHLHPSLQVSSLHTQAFHMHKLSSPHLPEHMISLRLLEPEKCLTSIEAILSGSREYGSPGSLMVMKLQYIDHQVHPYGFQDSPVPNTVMLGMPLILGTELRNSYTRNVLYHLNDYPRWINKFSLFFSFPTTFQYTKMKL